VAQAKEKALRSKRLYWVLGTIVAVVVLFTVYYSVYVSAQQAYYTDRAFRLLSSMSDKFSLHVRIADNVLRASTSYKDAEEAGIMFTESCTAKLKNMISISPVGTKLIPRQANREGLLRYLCRSRRIAFVLLPNIMRGLKSNLLQRLSRKERKGASLHPASPA